MTLRKRKIQYLKAHYRRHDDQALAEELGLDLAGLRKLMDAARLLRTKEEKEWIKEHPDEELPEFTAQAPLPESPAILQKRDYATAFVCALAAIVVYWLTLPPTVTGEDAGELITAAYTLGIPHPSGYPIWVLLAHPFTYIPFGTVAWRVAFMSASFGGATVFVLCLTIIKLAGIRWAAAVGALTFAFSAEFWEQAVIAEVYTLNNFFIICCVFLLYHWYEQRKDWVLFVFAAVYGLSLCNHHTMLILGPIFVGFVILVDLYFWKRWRLYFGCTLLALSMLSIYLYLPIRSLADPPVDWGNPETWDGFRDVVTRAQYSFGFEDKEVSISNYLRQFWDFLSIYIWEFTPWICWLPFLGIYALWKKDKYAFLFIGAIAGMMSVGFILVLNFEHDRQSLWLNNVFWIPAYMMGAIGIGLALQWLSQRKLSDFPSRPVAWLLGIAAIVSPLIMHYERNDKSDYWFAYDIGKNILDSLDKDAIYFPTSDHLTFPVMYLHSVEGYRADISIANKYGYVEKDLYDAMPRDMLRQLSERPTLSEEEFIEDWIIENTDRPVYFTKRKRFANLEGHELAQVGLVFRVMRPGESMPETDYWALNKWHTTIPESTLGELSADYILADYYFMRGRELMEQGDIPGAHALFQISMSLGGETQEQLNNIGSACAEAGAFGYAEQYLKRGVELFPEYQLVRRNLGRLYMEVGFYDKALLELERLLKFDDKDILAVRWSAECMLEIGWVEDAVARYEYLIMLRPTDYKLYRDLGLVYLSRTDDKQRGYAFLARSLELNPGQPQLEQMLAQAEENVLAPESLLPRVPGPEDVLPKLPTGPDIPLPQVPQLPIGPAPPQTP